MVDDGWCGVCQTTTDGNCLHLEDGTNIPNPAREIKKLQDEIERLRKRIGWLSRLLKRYRRETPLGHQPHMIAHEVDDALRELEVEDA